MFRVSTYEFLVRATEEERPTIVRIIWWADVFHFKDITAFGASSDRAVAGHLLWGKEEGLEFGLFPLWIRVIQRQEKGGRGKEGILSAR